MNQSDTTASFGYWIRRQRMALDLTQAELARQVGCATVTVSKIERDERRPSRQMAKLLADHLAIPEDEQERFLVVALGEESVVRMPVTSEPITEELNPSPPLSSLPTSSTPFVGRTADLEQIIKKITVPDCRLLSLVSPGGFGKTRLAVRAGKLLSLQNEHFSDGIFFVSLDGLEGPEQVVPAIASALRYTFIEQQDQQELLLKYLANKCLLLILDNAEQILDPELVAQILSKATNVKILTTTREAMNLIQEWLLPVDGMRVDEAIEEVKTKSTNDDAIQLFNATAIRVQPNFSAESEREHVLCICRLVGGVPLAIELSAAWCKVLPCGQIADELEQNLALLSTTMYNVPERHRSMNAILEQSWSFLSEEEQKVFQRLSIFVGGFQSDAAQAVADASFMVIASLMEKSILQLGQNSRYRIHPLLRQFGSGKLAELSEEQNLTQQKHSQFYIYFLDQRNESITGREQMRVLGEVEEEFDNIRLAWRHATQSGTFEHLEKALPSLFRYLWTRGRFEDGERLMDFALDKQKESNNGSASINIELMLRNAQFKAVRGNHEEAFLLIDEAKKLIEKNGPSTEQALCFYVSGLTRFYMRDQDKALKSLRKAYTLYKQLDDKSGIAQSALELAMPGMYIGTDFELLKEAKESLHLFHELGDLAGMAEAYNIDGAIHLLLEDFDSAEKSWRESLSIAQQINDHQTIARSTGGLGMIALCRRDWDVAIRYLFDRLRKSEKIYHEGEIHISIDLICMALTNDRRYEEAMDLIKNYPHPWRNFRTAEIQIAVGSFQEAMSYLIKDTEAAFDSRNGPLLAPHLIAWAMLLQSPCPLVKKAVQAANTSVLLERVERLALANDMLNLVRTYDECKIMTRIRADTLLSEIQEKNSDIELDALRLNPGHHTIMGFAQEMLTLRIR